MWTVQNKPKCFHPFPQYRWREEFTPGMNRGSVVAVHAWQRDRLGKIPGELISELCYSLAAKSCTSRLTSFQWCTYTERRARTPPHCLRFGVTAHLSLEVPFSSHLRDTLCAKAFFHCFISGLISATPDVEYHMVSHSLLGQKKNGQMQLQSLSDGYPCADRHGCSCAGHCLGTRQEKVQWKCDLKLERAAVFEDISLEAFHPSFRLIILPLIFQLFILLLLFSTCR